MAAPETRYARSGRVNIAYQIVGEGPFDLIWVPGWVSNIEASWEVPEYARFLGRLASFSRLILFDKRGTGMSDRPDTRNQGGAACPAQTLLPKLDHRRKLYVSSVMDGSTSALLLS